MNEGNDEGVNSTFPVIQQTPESDSVLHSPCITTDAILFDQFVEIPAKALVAAFDWKNPGCVLIPY